MKVQINLTVLGARWRFGVVSDDRAIYENSKGYNLPSQEAALQAAQAFVPKGAEVVVKVSRHGGKPV